MDKLLFVNGAVALSLILLAIFYDKIAEWRDNMTWKKWEDWVKENFAPTQTEIPAVYYRAFEDN